MRSRNRMRMNRGKKIEGTLQGSSTPSMTGREGLGEYADDLGVAGLVTAPTPIDGPLSMVSAAIHTGLDFTDPKLKREEATWNTAVRLGISFLPVGAKSLTRDPSAETIIQPIGNFIENKLVNEPND